MRIAQSKNRRPKTDAAIADVLAGVSATNLRRYVASISFPRHYDINRAANLRARDWLLDEMREFGFEPVLQGEWDNIVATAGAPEDGPQLLLGAHYDSVPGTPGADDNGSAVAVCLECARVIKDRGIDAVTVVFFNREEDGLLGSSEWVKWLTGQTLIEVDEAHIFEMVGYCTRQPRSQRMPAGLPGVSAPDVGDFLALLANRRSNAIAEELLTLSASYVPRMSTLALKVYFGLEKYVGHLNRSDHAPFWQAGIPAIMWTDTSEFRNPNYHRITDTPESLDYEFMAHVTKLALARAITHSNRK
jgi:Zn-dependent M28 family amino/carboxypeptidase